MFESNGKISLRQVKLLVLLDGVGTGCLLLPTMTTRWGKGQHLTALLGGLLVTGLLYWYYMEMGRRKGPCGIVSKGIYLFRFSWKIIFLCGFFIMLLKDYMLPKGNAVWMMAAFLLVVGYSSLRGIEELGRLKEALVWVVLLCVAVMLLVGIWRINPTLILDGKSRAHGAFDVGALPAFITGAYGAVIAMTPLELILFYIPHLQQASKEKTDDTTWWRSARTAMLRLYGMLAGILCLWYVLTVGMLGIRWTGEGFGVSAYLVEQLELPGGLPGRMDVFMMIFWVVGMFCVISSFVFMSLMLLREVCPMGMKWIVLAGGLLIAGICALLLYWKGETLAKVLVWLAILDVPVAIAQAGIRRGSHKEWKHKGACFLVGVLSMWAFTGCQERSVDIEDRSYVQVFAIEPVIYEEIGDMAAQEEVTSGTITDYRYTISVTNMNGYEVGKGSKPPSKVYRGMASSLSELQTCYAEGSDKVLDFGHVKAIILDESYSYANREAKQRLEKLLSQIRAEHILSGNVRVFFSGQAGALVASDGEDETQLGERLLGAVRHGRYEGTTLGTYMVAQLERLEEPMLLIRSDGGELTIEKYGLNFSTCE